MDKNEKKPIELILPDGKKSAFMKGDSVTLTKQVAVTTIGYSMLDYVAVSGDDKYPVKVTATTLDDKTLSVICTKA